MGYDWGAAYIKQKTRNSVGISGQKTKKITVGGAYQEYGIVQHTGWLLEINTKIQPNSQTHWKNLIRRFSCSNYYYFT